MATLLLSWTRFRFRRLMEAFDPPGNETHLLVAAAAAALRYLLGIQLSPVLQAWLQISAKGLREKQKKENEANSLESSDLHSFAIQSIKEKSFAVLSSQLSCSSVKLLFHISLYLHSLLARIYSDIIQRLDLNPERK